MRVVAVAGVQGKSRDFGKGCRYVVGCGSQVWKYMMRLQQDFCDALIKSFLHFLSLHIIYQFRKIPEAVGGGISIFGLGCPVVW